MKKEDLTKLGVDEETAVKIVGLHDEELKGFIPKSRFDEVNTAKKTAEDLLKERDNQIETLKAASGDAASLKKQIEDLQKKNQQETEKHNAQMKQLRLDNGVAAALTEAKAKNQKAVKALLDLTKVELQEDGTLKGLEEQVKALKESEDSSFLFSADTKPKLKGAKTGENGSEDPDKKVNLDEMSYDELSAYFTEHPDAAT